MPTPATVYISETNGAGATVTDNITNLNFGSLDSPNLVAANHPVIISENSFQKFIRFKVQSLGTSSVIKDLRPWKSAGVYVTGEAILADTRGYNNDLIVYATPTQLPGQAIYTFETSDPGAARVGINGSTANQFPTNQAVPGYSEYTVLITTSTGLTPAGVANTKTITFQYDET